jgi:cell division transport system permease protein
MSMTEPDLDPDAGPREERAASRMHPDGALPSFGNSIVPKATIGGRALTAVVAIMTFLAALTTGAVMMVRAASNDWQSEVAREVTIQVRPVAGRDLEADIANAAAIARATSGVAEVRPYTKDESARLLEPWLGAGLGLDDLPIPRLIVVRIGDGAAPDFLQLRNTLTEQIPSANLDDHRGFVERMRAMAQTAVLGGVGVLALVLVATMLSVTFATRGAMATNRPVIEVLHFIGAKDNFIAGHLQRHFLVLGLTGGAIGGGSALALFGLTELADRWLRGSAAADQFAALFGAASIGWTGYAAVVVQVILIASLTALTSRMTVNRMLATIH